MTEPDPIEVTTRYATSVDELGEAWAFVMSHIDSVGPDPTVEITPFWTITATTMDDDDPPRRFGVVVSGMIRES